ncbi:RWD domain-containing protein 2B-like [Anneissia japonica]|uniref:RWD domain-containing protein 2B-like n=1 Tax=Anneissia japonica TaxID=1529436 RepID=UPI001425536B|nr:RWD domain-containing protein 2B-like [Anneissia japonica]
MMAHEGMLSQFELQISELDMMKCMYPNDGELEIDDPDVIADIKQFCACGESEHVATMGPSFTRQLSYAINFIVDEKTSIKLICDLPHAYPSELPELIVRSDSFSRDSQRQLNEDLQRHIREALLGELCVGEAINWIQDNSQRYLEIKADTEGPATKSKQCNEAFCRLWIHSHHIYSKFKRRDILEWAKEFKVTGFCLPGKPGIICLEGDTESCEEYWHRLRRLTWKKISCKHREDIPLEGREVADLRKFTGFEEKAFNPHSNERGGREYHMDLGMLFKFLEEHDCADVFKILLGVDGKASNKS